jgi:thioredoxin reductase
MNSLGGIDALVVGAGPAGLSAAIELRRQGLGRVVVVDRELEAGGIPRHSAHQGFGLRDLHRSLSGPAYAAALEQRARSAGAELRLGTTVTEVDAMNRIQLTSAGGRQLLEPRAVLLATGARERPRPARLVPGDRPAGIFTTGQLQQWVARGLPVGRRALIVGAEHVSYSAVLTLRHAGTEVAGLVTELPRQQSLPGASMLVRATLRATTHTGTRLVDILGRRRVQSVVLEELSSGARRQLAVDTVVFTGDWIPDFELARRAGLSLDRGTLGPATDAEGRSDLPGLWAAGNLVHPVETAARAALGGRRAATAMARSLRGGAPNPARLAIEVEAPLLWAWPNLLSVGEPVEVLVLRLERFSEHRRVRAQQGGHVLGEAKLRGRSPNRRLSLPGSLLEGRRPDGGTIRLSLI